jgi:hypothetical protein
MKDRMITDSLAGLLALFLVSPAANAISGSQEDCANQVIHAIETLRNSRAVAHVEGEIPTIGYKEALIGGVPDIQHTPYYQFQAPDHSYVTVVDLSSPKVRGNPKFTKLLEAWNQVTDEKLRELEQFKHLPPGSFNSLDFPDRTVALIRTTKSVNDRDYEITGGVRVVFSNSHEEPLPFQKDFPDVPRGVKASETGRLTGSGNATMLVHFAMKVIKNSPETREIYVHTSYKHEVLYRRSGAKLDEKEIVKKDKFNWLLPFVRTHLDRVLLKTRGVLFISAG